MDRDVTSVAIVKPERAAAVAGGIVQRHGTPQKNLIVGNKRTCPLRPVSRGADVAGFLIAVHQRAHRPNNEIDHARALVREPLLESLALVREVNPCEQFAAIQIHRLFVSPRGNGVAQARHVARQYTRVDRQRLVALGNERTVADRLAEVIQGVPERPSRGELIEIRPEHRCKRVAAVIAGATRDREIRQQRETLGLRHERAELTTVGVADGMQAEKS